MSPTAHSGLRRRFGVATSALVLCLSGSAAAATPTHLDDKVEPHLNQGLGEPPAGMERSTPRTAWAALLDGCQNKRWEHTAHVLNLGDTPPSDQKAVGSLAAQKLCELLAETDQLSAAGLDASEVGPIEGERPTNYVVAATIPLPDGTTGEVWLRRVQNEATDRHAWVVTRQTVSKIQLWYQMLIKKDERLGARVDVVNEGLGPIRNPDALKTPRAAARRFAELTREGQWQDAARLLDLSAHAPQEQQTKGPRLARRLAMILKRIHTGGYGGLSNDPTGAIEKGVPYYEEVVARGTIEEQPVDIRLSRYTRSDGAAFWLFSQGTVAAIDPVYATLGYGWAGDYLPPPFFGWELWNIQLWQWIGLLLALLIGYLIGLVGSYILRKIMLRLARWTSWAWDDALVAALRGPLVAVFWALGFIIIVSFLALAPAPLKLMLGLAKVVVILAIGWFLMRVMDVIADQLLARFRERQGDMGMAMIPVARKILKPIVFIIIAIVALQNIGMDVGGLLAGLGIGGLAFALAAKDTLANLFGSVAMAFDRPFKVGDFIKVDDLLGTVEDVGLRSTKVRTLDRTIITVPNAQMADSKIENYTVRDRIRLVSVFGVQYDTSPDQVRYIIDEFKRYLLVHPRVVQEGWRVRFVGYSSSSKDIEIYCYVSSTDFTEFTGIKEGILIDLGDIIVAAGAEFAFPSQTVYVGKDSQADGDKARIAASAVEQRRAAGLLSLPDIPDALREQIANEPAQGEAGEQPEKARS